MAKFNIDDMRDLVSGSLYGALDKAVDNIDDVRGGIVLQLQQNQSELIEQFDRFMVCLKDINDNLNIMIYDLDTICNYLEELKK